MFRFAKLLNCTRLIGKSSLTPACGDCRTDVRSKVVASLTISIPFVAAVPLSGSFLYVIPDRDTLY